jgi:hypothetical protein
MSDAEACIGHLDDCDLAIVSRTNLNHSMGRFLAFRRQSLGSCF